MDTLPLSDAEGVELDRCDRVIGAGIKTFIEVGNALSRVRDGKLYRTTHATCIEYCTAVWNLSDRRARQLVDGAAIADAIAESGTIVPVTNEGQARALTVTAACDQLDYAQPDRDRLPGWIATLRESIKPQQQLARRLQKVLDGHNAGGGR